MITVVKTCIGLFGDIFLNWQETITSKYNKKAKNHDELRCAIHAHVLFDKLHETIEMKMKYKTKLSVLEWKHFYL